MVSFEQLLAAQRLYQTQLMAKSNVVGVAIGYKESNGETTDQLAIVALVEQKKPSAALTKDDLIPAEFEGATTDVREIGVVRAQNVGPRDKWRPQIPAGVSVGHHLVTAGTLGALVRDRRTGERYILSNNHVLANSNDAFIGDPVLQPAATDRGINPADVIARLERFQALQYIGDVVTTQPPAPQPPPPPTGGTNPTPPTQPPAPSASGCDIADFIVTFGNTLAKLNGSDKRLSVASASSLGTSAPVSAQSASAPTNLMDCALAKPLNPAMFSDDIRNIGRITGTRPPALGMQVRKTGRTTDTTFGVINLLNATIDVGYNTAKGPRTARFIGQVITSGMSQGGDSGALIVEATGLNAVGLLFAGSGVATIFTPIDVVLDALGVMF